MTATGVCPKCQRQFSAGTGRMLCSACLFEAALADRQEHATLLESAEGNALPAKGRCVGDFELLEEIARGGMGVVYRARQKGLGRVVALKMILSGQFASEAELSRFRKEAEAVARLDHPNIVPIYHVGEDCGRPYFAMKLIEGGTIATRVNDENAGRAPEKPASSNPHSSVAILVAKTCRAVHFAHQHGILHRDLKPANILLDSQGEPHVTDFGLAKQLGSSLELTGSGTILGSPNYMAPELAAGCASEITTAADVWSLGAILYELLAGQPPFLAATPMATIRAVLESEPITPSQLMRKLASKSKTAISKPGIERDLETICLKCLEKNPSRRYGSAEALAEDLERWLRHEPIQARPVSLWEIGWKWARRKPAWAAFLAIAAIAPSMIIGVLLLMGSRLTRERNHVQQQEQITRQNLYAADISVAWRALDGFDYGLAWATLEACQPDKTAEQPITANRASFEWRWLWQRAQGQAQCTVAAHPSPVHALAYSPDGRFMASASDDGTTKLWDASAETVLRTIEVPVNPTPLRLLMDKPNQFCSAAFSIDSRTLLTGCMNQASSLWEPESGRRLWSLPSNNFYLALCSPTATNLALVRKIYGKTQGPLMAILDLAKGEYTAVFTNCRADALCFTPGGDAFVRWDRRTQRISLQDFPSGGERSTFDTSGLTEFYAESLLVTPDSRTLAACNLWRGPIELFDLPSLRHTGQLVGQAGKGDSLAVSPDGRWLASGSHDQTIRLWDLAARREVRQLLGHRGPVLALAFSPDSRHLASGGLDGTVRFWDVVPPPTPPPMTNVFGAFAFSPDGCWLITQNTYRDAGPLAPLREAQDSVPRPSLASLWELPERGVAQEWQTSPFQSAIFQTNQVLLLASNGSSNEPPCVRAFSIPPRPAAFGANQYQTGAQPLSTQVFRGIPSPCSVITLSSDGLFAATGHGDGTVALWETGSGRLLHKAIDKFHDPNGKILAPYLLEFSADSRTVAGLSDGSVMSWSLPDLTLLGLQTGFYASSRLAISPKGELLAMGGRDHGSTVDLYNASFRQPGSRLRGHHDSICDLDFSPDGSTLASVSLDDQLKLWNLATGRELGTVMSIPEASQFVQVVFSRDGSWLGASDNTGRLYLFHAPKLGELNPSSSP